ncbi:MAG: iron-containing alcohol dehydrogenase, partial [Anaerolineaceae bacterium]|nr:iron-containing alcohol dehydrogenase [Anaerolineaceae bacterium]
MKLPYDPANLRFWEDISKLPGYPVDDEIRLRRMIFESGAVYQIAKSLSESRADISAPVLVVMDSTPMRRGEESLKPLILAHLEKEGWKSEPLVLQPDDSGQTHAGMHTIAVVKQKIRPGISVLAVGSGTITDITKHACYLYEQETGQALPLVAFQTANSVTAFTSELAVMFVDGVKRTLPSRYPDALICDLETLRDAPYEMTAAGVGDLLSGYVSYADWYLAYRFGIDPTYSELTLRLIGPLDEILLAEAEGIRKGSLEAMAVLAKAISLAGIAMSLTHTTTPLSGYEHIISHVLDMQAEANNQPLAQHGTQVALASIIGVEVYRCFVEEFDPVEINLDQCYPEADATRAKIEEAFVSIDPSGKVAAECFSDYRQKLEAWRANRELHVNTLMDWETI